MSDTPVPQAKVTPDTPATPLPTPGQPGQPGLGTMNVQTAAPAAPQAPAQVAQVAVPSDPDAQIKANASMEAAQPQAQATPQSRHARIFDSILNSISGPSAKMVTTDDAGNSSIVNQPRVSLGHTIVAGALAGMMAQPTFRQGAYGPVYAGRPGAAEAGAAIPKQMSDNEKALQDDLFARKMLVAKQTTESLHQFAALSHQNMVDGQMVADNNAPMFSAAKDYDLQRPAGAPAALYAQHVTMADIATHPDMKDMWFKRSFSQDGVTSTTDPATGITKTVPTYSIFNPAVKVALSQDAIGIMSQLNPQWQDAWKASNGDVKLDLLTYASQMNQVNSVKMAENFFARNADELGISGTQAQIEGKLTAAVRKDPMAIKGLMEAENAVAQQGNVSDALKRIRQVSGSTAIFDALGMSRQDVDDYITNYDDKRTQDIAKAKKVVTMNSVNDANRILSAPTTGDGAISADDPRRTAATSFIRLTEKIKADEAQTAQSIKDGSPEDAAKLLVSGAVSPSEIVSTRNASFATKAYTAAVALDPMFNAQVAQARFDTAKTPANLAFFGSADSLVSKDGTLDQLLRNLPPNGQIPAINGVVNWVTHEVGGVAPTGFLATAIGVADDYSKVMGQGAGSDTSRQMALDSIMSSQNPAQMAKVAAGMRAAVNSQIKSRIGNNFVMDRMYGQNLQSQADAVQAQKRNGGVTAPSGANPASQFTHVSSDGKWGWNGSTWVAIAAQGSK